MQTLLLVSVIVSLFCIGLKIISSSGMILYFLRRPYDSLSKELPRLEKAIKEDRLHVAKATLYIDMMEDQLIGYDNLSLGWESCKKELDEAYKQKMMIGSRLFEDTQRLRIVKLFVYTLKPIIGCGTCMASVWTLVLAPFLMNGFHWVEMLIIAFIVAAMNAVGMGLYDLIKSNIKECNCE